MPENMTPTENELPVEKRRLRWNRFLKWTGIILGGLTAILILSTAVFLWRSSGALERKLQALRDAGAPVSVADLVSAPISPEENAAVYYRRARKELQAIGQALKAVRQSDNWPDGPLTQDQLQTIQRAMAAYPNVMPLVHQGASCPKFRSEVNEEFTVAEFQSASMDELQECRSVARYLSDRCRMLIAEGHRDKAMETCILNFQLARQLQRQPAVVAHLVTLAVRAIAIDSTNHVLRSGTVSDSMRDALTAELARHDLTAGCRHALISEHPYGLAAFNDLNFGRFWPIRGLWNNAVIYYLDVMDQQLTLASQPYFAILQAPPQAVSKPASPWAAIVDMVLPAIDAAREATERNRAAMRCLRIVIAITQIEQQGGEVTGLDDLKLPKQQTIDPFTGQPLRMKKRPDGWVVYSVGKDLQDDGGQLDEQADMGLGPVSQLPAIAP